MKFHVHHVALVSQINLVKIRIFEPPYHSNFLNYFSSAYPHFFPVFAQVSLIAYVSLCLLDSQMLVLPHFASFLHSILSKFSYFSKFQRK